MSWLMVQNYLKPRKSSLLVVQGQQDQCSGMESSLVMTSDDILEMNEVPENLVIIGGGVVGIDLDKPSWPSVAR